MSYGAIDRHLGGLAAVLGRRDAAIAHLRAAIGHNAELGCIVWRLRSQLRLQRLAPDAALEAEVAAAARALGVEHLAGQPPVGCQSRNASSKLVTSGRCSRAVMSWASRSVTRICST